MAEKKAKTKIIPLRSSLKGGGPLVTTLVEVDSRTYKMIRVVERICHISEEELAEDKKKMRSNIGRAASELPSFQ